MFCRTFSKVIYELSACSVKLISKVKGTSKFDCRYNLSASLQADGFVYRLAKMEVNRVAF